MPADPSYYVETSGEHGAKECVPERASLDFYRLKLATGADRGSPSYEAAGPIADI